MAGGWDRTAAEPAGGVRKPLPYRDRSNLLLATRLGDDQLSAGHGVQARLVAPNRRGFSWIKWVTEISVYDQPWWWQPPFPLA